MMEAAEATWVRRNGILWSIAQPTENGPIDWGALAGLEADLIRARDAGMEPILVVRSTPEWAEHPDFGVPCGPMAPEHRTAFGNFMKEMVRHFAVEPYGVKYFEIWNEPDVDPVALSDHTLPFGCWGDRDDPYYGGRYYGGVLKIIEPLMTSEYPHIKVVVGGLLLDCDPINPPPGKDCTPSKFLEGILVAGGGPYFDGVSFHAYDFYSPGNNYFGNPNWNSGRVNGEPNGNLIPVQVAKANYLQALLASFGYSDKFLVNTEIGVICGGAFDPPGGPGCEAEDTSPFELTKAWYVPQAYATALSEGLIGSLWYTPLGWRNSGLLYSDLTPRPAYTAFAFARATLQDASFVQEITTNPDMNAFQFALDGKKIWVVWSKSGAVETIQLPSTPDNVWNSLGQPINLSGLALSVGRNPRYVIWNP